MLYVFQYNKCGDRVVCAFLPWGWLGAGMSENGGEDGRGRPRTVAGEDVLAAFGEVKRPVATASVLAEQVDASKQTVWRRLRELYEEGEVERWEVGARAVVWWPTSEK